VGLGLGDSAGPIAQDRLVNIFAKAEASPEGSVRGCRHTMLDDSDISATRHARAAVGGLIAGLAGTSAVYVSGGAEHQAAGAADLRRRSLAYKRSRRVRLLHPQAAETTST
jgi:cyanuric acid amidohydrolase